MGDLNNNTNDLAVIEKNKELEIIQKKIQIKEKKHKIKQLLLNKESLETESDRIQLAVDVTKEIVNEMQRDIDEFSAININLEKEK